MYGLVLKNVHLKKNTPKNKNGQTLWTAVDQPKSAKKLKKKNMAI